jgi:hypothetical protein
MAQGGHRKSSSHKRRRFQVNHRAKFLLIVAVAAIVFSTLTTSACFDPPTPTVRASHPNDPPPTPTPTPKPLINVAPVKREINNAVKDVERGINSDIQDMKDVVDGVKNLGCKVEGVPCDKDP